jgi:hypothetical protein
VGVAPKKKPKGELKNQRIPIMMTEEELKLIDDWGFKHRIRSRGEAIRRLCQIGIATSDGRQTLRDSTDKVIAKFSDFSNSQPAGKISKFLDDFTPDLLEALGHSRLISIMSESLERGGTFDEAIGIASAEKEFFAEILKDLEEYRRAQRESSARSDADENKDK